MDRLRATLLSNKDAFCYSTADLKGYSSTMCDAKITLQHKNKVFEHPRRHSPEHLEALDKILEDMLLNGLIEPTPRSDTNYAACNHLVPQKNADGELEKGLWRFTTDFRKLNSACNLDTKLMPRADEIFVKLGNRKIFSKMDMRAGFF